MYRHGQGAVRKLFTGIRIWRSRDGSGLHCHCTSFSTTLALQWCHHERRTSPGCKQSWGAEGKPRYKEQKVNAKESSKAVLTDINKELNYSRYWVQEEVLTQVIAWMRCFPVPTSHTEPLLLEPCKRSYPWIDGTWSDYLPTLYLNCLNFFNSKTLECLADKNSRLPVVREFFSSSLILSDIPQVPADICILKEKFPYWFIPDLWSNKPFITAKRTGTNTFNMMC